MAERLLKYNMLPVETGNVYPLLIGNEEISVTVIATTLDNPISFANSYWYFDCK